MRVGGKDSGRCTVPCNGKTPAIKKGKSYKDLPFGPSGEIRTHGLMVPNHARYQLRYTRI